MNNKQNYFLILLLITCLFSCSDDETNPFQDMESECDSFMGSPNLSIPLALKVDSREQDLDEGYYSMLLDDTLYIGGENAFYSFKMVVPSPTLGIHQITASDGVEASILDYSSFKNMSADCGILRIDELDVSNGNLEAFFHFTASTPTGDATATVYNGAVNSIEVSDDPYCSRKYTVEVQDEPLDFEGNYWAFSASYDIDGDEQLLPPCDRVVVLRYSEQNNQLEIVGPGTSILMGLNVDNDQVDFSDFFASSAQTDSPALLEFQQEFIAVLRNANMTYTIENNVLTMVDNDSDDTFEFYFWQ